MDYVVVFQEIEIELKPYSLSIASSIEKLESSLYADKSFKDRCKAAYNFLETVIDKDVLHEVLGEFNDEIDPNKIMLLYMTVVKSYNSPIDNFSKEETIEDVEKANSMLENLNKAPQSVQRLQSVAKKK